MGQKFRHEYKHTINPADFAVLRQRLSAIMQPDSFSRGGKYEVRSLYFDNLFDKALTEKINGVNYREKFRIRLYNGDTEAFTALVAEYKAELANAPETAEDKETKTKAYWQSQIDWLLERFPDGEYRDVIGLCKAAPLKGEDGIEDQDYSLNAGRYVGVVIEDDGMTEEEFKEEMLLLSKELEKINNEVRSLEERVSLNLQELFNK